MKTVKVNLRDRPYKIIIKKNIFASIAANHFSNYRKSKVIIITDKNVAKYYIKNFLDFFGRYKFDIQVVVLPSGEKSKDLLVKYYQNF